MSLFNSYLFDKNMQFVLLEKRKNMSALRESCYLRKNLTRVSSKSTFSLYFCVQWTGHFICKKDFYIDRSNLESYLLLYTVSGKGVLNYKGRRYLIPPRAVVIIDCKEHHEYFPESDGWDFWYIHFYGANTAEIFRFLESEHGGVVFSEGADMLHFFERVYRVVEKTEADPVCSELIYRILMRLAAMAPAREPKKGEPEWLKAVYDAINDDDRNGITVEELSQIAHMSRCHFSIAFKKQTGFTPYNYLLTYRLSSAKRLLVTTEESVSEIGYRCGFSDPSGFIRAFKRQEGMSPLSYRKHLLLK